MRKRNTPSENKMRQLRADVLNENRTAEAATAASTKRVTAGTTSTNHKLHTCWGCLKYLILVVIAVPFINYTALLQEARELLPPGQLYDIGYGQRLFLNCTGEGLPTVILDAPTGMTSDIWVKVQKQIAKFTRVCIYDRAGLGFSDRPFTNRSNDAAGDTQKTAERWQKFTVERMADDLYRLLSYSSQQPKPFILVGSGIGALIARFYTQLYEGDVADLVLVDPLVEAIFNQDEGNIWSDFWFNQLGPSFVAQQLFAAMGLTRMALLFGMVQPSSHTTNISATVDRRQRHLLCNPRHLSSVVDEHHFINDSFSQIRTVQRIKPFPANVSVSVITSGTYDKQLSSDLNEAWSRAQRHLVTRVHQNSKHIVVSDADNRTIYHDSSVITNTIRKLVQQWNKKKTVTLHKS